MTYLAWLRQLANVLMSHTSGKRRDGKVDRKQLVLTAMAPASQQAYSPVQIQKLLFLIDRELHDTYGDVFSFQAYHYGPFDKTVYATLDELENEGLIEILGDKFAPWRSYRLTPLGQERGRELFEQCDESAHTFIQKASDFVRSQPFASLVAAIYKKYPDMKQNSVFQE